MLLLVQNTRIIKSSHLHQEPLITIDDLAAGDDKDNVAFFVGRQDIISGIESTIAGVERRIKSHYAKA